MYELIDRFGESREIPVDFVESSGMMKTEGLERRAYR